MYNYKNATLYSKILMQKYKEKETTLSLTPPQAINLETTNL